VINKGFLNTNSAITNVKSGNARIRMEVSSAGKREYGTMKDRSSTRRVSAAGFHYVTARSNLARVFLKFINRSFFNFQIFFFRAAVNRGY
jgi:hypothetical protein